ncbi:DUF3397 domain-containing protein [Virgibacillus kekensis]|uniref:DUF3397 domain-containing protein n=1 Tax=Virgibacillus kekensis TaxID=202261 RepID=A0ABV9DGM2_9BACI
MMNLVSYLIGFILTAPVIVTLLVYFAAGKLSKSRWRAVHKAVNWTTGLYIISVCILLEVVFNNSYVGIVMVLLLGTLAAIVILQWKMYTEVIFKNVFKIFWRFSFLLFAFLYIFLVFYGITEQLFFI